MNPHPPKKNLPQRITGAGAAGWEKAPGKHKAIAIGVIALWAAIIVGAASDGSTDNTTDPKPRSTSSSPKTTTTPAATETTAAPKPKPNPKLEAAQKLADLSEDVRKNTIDEVGKERVRRVVCDRETGPVSCTIEYDLGDMWDADENEVARDIGGLLHELYRDTDVNTLYVLGYTTGIDNLGNEDKNFNAVDITITRAGWKKLDWENVKYMEPADAFREVSVLYVDRIKR